MTGLTLEEVDAALGLAATGPAPGTGLCGACRDVLAVDGAGITLATGQDRPQLCVTDPVTARLEELQFTLGEGPSVQASAGQPVAEIDLAAPGPSPWPAFAAAAVELGIRAVFAFPLGVGAARIGVLTLYQVPPGALRADCQVAALHAAELVTHQVVALQAGAGAGHLADGLAEAGMERAEVHQASGMLSVQLGVSVGEALIRLRGHAFRTGSPVGEVATEVVGRRLRLER